MVAKWECGRYHLNAVQTSWIKIKNSMYTHMARRELFEQRRHADQRGGGATRAPGAQFEHLKALARLAVIGCDRFPPGPAMEPRPSPSLHRRRWRQKNGEMRGNRRPVAMFEQKEVRRQNLSATRTPLTPGENAGETQKVRREALPGVS